jgi:hypothetical protein
MITKELLSEVLGIRVEELRLTGNVYDGIDLTQGINIYELAHRVKEWAFDKHLFIISSEKHAKHWYVNVVQEPKQLHAWYTADTEPEAVIAMGEWVLKNLKGK